MARRANVHPFSNTIQPATSGVITSSSLTRPRKPSRLPTSTIDFDGDDIASLHSPGIMPSPSLSAPLDPHKTGNAGSPSSLHYHPRTLSNLASTNARIALIPTQTSDLKGQQMSDTGLTSHPAPAFSGRINDIQQSEAATRTSNLLPSVAELEGGVSPFLSIDGRRGSMSSCSSRRPSSSGKSSCGRCAAKPHSI